jgi:hypothetical protein
MGLFVGLPGAEGSAMVLDGCVRSDTIMVPRLPPHISLPAPLSRFYSDFKFVRKNCLRIRPLPLISLHLPPNHYGIHTYEPREIRA